MKGKRAAAPTLGNRVERGEVSPVRVVAMSADMEAMEAKRRRSGRGVQTERRKEVRVYVRFV